MKPLIFINNPISIKIYNYKFQVIGKLKLNKNKNDMELYIIKNKFISVSRLPEIFNYFNKHKKQYIKGDIN